MPTDTAVREITDEEIDALRAKLDDAREIGGAVWKKGALDN